MSLLPVAILAGGLATRLRPMTERIPKALIEIAGRPFIHHQLAFLAAQGVTRVVLCLGYLGSMVRDSVADGAAFGLRVEYSFDGDTLLGTGGALRRALPALGERFFVLYGDSYLPISFAPVQKAYLASGAPALMTVLRNANRWDTSNVVYRSGWVIDYDKRTPSPEMHYIDYGLGLLEAPLLASRKADVAFDLADVYATLARAGRLAGFEVEERFYEIGSHAGIRDAEKYLSARNP
jgi:MurNAc alpha-1-phosphate uridylyltransferase